MAFFGRQRYGGVYYHHEISSELDVKWHCHGSFEIVYILQGEGSYNVEGVHYPIRPHTLFLTRPMEYHAIELNRDCNYERVVLQFEERVLPPSLSELSLLTHGGRCFFPIHTVGSRIADTLSVLLATDELSHNGEETVHTPQNKAFLAASLTQLLLLLSREAPETSAKQSDGLAAGVIDYLNNHLCEEVTLECLEREFFVSRYHLSRVFRRQTGISVFQYFNIKRMTLAEQLLRSGSPATQVAMQLGFRDYSTFYRAYRKHTGQAPGEVTPRA